MELEGRVWDWIVGMDHRPVELEVRIIDERMDRKERDEGIVD